MALRAENTLFLDDEVFNLKEAEHTCPGIMTAGPEFLDELYCEIAAIDSTDHDHRRLSQYHILEKKREGQKKAVSNEEFLRASDIRVTCLTDCAHYENRIHELLNRTNQLNFTKERPSREEVKALLSDENYECALVRLRDNYGDYGEIGFYAKECRAPHRLRHFAFSCRVLGTGVEQYIYAKLGFPPLDVVGDTAVELKNERTVDWISVEEDIQATRKAVSEAGRATILLKGPCDIDGMLPYFKIPDIYELEAPFVDERGIVVGSSCSLHLYEAWHYPIEEIRKTVGRTTFLSEADFVTFMFSEPHDVVVFSTLSDGHAGVYRDRENGIRICFSSRNFDLTDPGSWDKFISGEYANANAAFTRDDLERFAGSFAFEGGLDPLFVVRNLKWMREKLPDSTKLILLLGSETEAADNTPEFADHAPVYRALNREIRAVFGDAKDVELINITDHITGQDQFAGATNHFSRLVYRQLAERIEDEVDRWGEKE